MATLGAGTKTWKWDRSVQKWFSGRATEKVRARGSISLLTVVRLVDSLKKVEYKHSTFYYTFLD